MEVDYICVRVKRDVRLEKYNVPSLEVELRAQIKEGDDLEKCYCDLYDDADYIVDDLKRKEIEKFKEEVRRRNS